MHPSPLLSLRKLREPAEISCLRGCLPLPPPTATLECQAAPLEGPRAAATAAASAGEGWVVAVTALEAVGWAAEVAWGRAAVEAGAAGALGSGEAGCLLGRGRGRGTHLTPAAWLPRLHSNKRGCCLLTLKKVLSGSMIECSHSRRRWFNSPLLTMGRAAE